MASENAGRETNTLDRRDFLGKTMAVAAGATLAGACGNGPGNAAADAPAVQTRRNVQWRMVSSFPRSLDALYGAAERLAERLHAITDGAFVIRPYPAGELVPPFGVLDAVQQGTVQSGHTASYYYTGKSPVLAFDTGVPFGFSARQQNAWLYDGGGLELVHEFYAPFNIITFPGGNTGSQMGGWFKREINSTADLRGLKMRIPSLGGEIMARLGVTVQVLAGGDIYPALERGAIDATEWVGPYDDEKLGLQNAARFYYYPGWWEPGPSISFQVNRQAWESLPSVYQEAFRTAARHAAESTLTLYDARNPEALRRLVDGGTQLRRFSTEIMQAAQTTSTELMEENAARDATYRRVYDAWKRFREDSFRWFGTAEQAYWDFALRGTSAT